MKWFPFFKTGKHTSSKGAEFDATSEKLDRIIEVNKGREIPIAIGHPKESSPAWGWVDELKRSGDVLQAKPKQLVAEFESMVKKGMFKNVSVSLNPDLTIRHIGFLGATPPAIEGLRAEFSADENATVIEFSMSEAYAIQDIGSILQRLREWIIDKFDLETADKVVNQWQLDSIKSVKPEDNLAPASSFSQSQGGGDMPKTVQELEAELASERAAYAAVKSQIAEFSKTSEKVKTLEADLAAEKKKNQAQEFSAFLTGPEMAKRVSPAMRELLLPILEFAATATEPIEFSAPDPADEKKTMKVKKPAVELVKDFMKAHLPEILTTEELATKGKASDAAEKPHEFMAKVAEFAKANKVGEGAAVIEVAHANPELHQEWLANLKK